MTKLKQQKKEETDSNLVLFTGILSLFGPIVGSILFTMSNLLTEVKWLISILQGVSVLFLLCGMFGGWGLYFANEALAKYKENPNLYNNNKGQLIVGKVFSIISLLILALGFLIFVVSGAISDFSK